MLSPRIRAAKIAAAFEARGAKSFLLDGVRWTVHEIGIVDELGLPMVRAVLSARTPGGKVLIERDSPRNPFYWHNPPVMVPDGEEPNPSYDASKPESRPTRAKYRDDVIEAARVLLARLL